MEPVERVDSLGGSDVVSDVSEVSVDSDDYEVDVSVSDDGFGDDFEKDPHKVDADDIHGRVDLTDLASVKTRIESLCGILSNWSSASKNGIATKKRSSYVSQLQRMVSAYYGYSDELAEYFMRLFSPTEAIQFFEANERPLPMTLRVNTLKTRRKELAAALIARGANVDPVGDWSKEGLVVNSSQVPIGATPEYLAGHYMMQSAASFIPVLALNPKEGEKVLDIAAAPGGKATHIAQLMNNGGVLYANDVNKERCTALVANIHRLGITNTIVTNYDGLDLKRVLPPLDRVLCDAPCSGLGVISKDPSAKVKRTLLDLKQNADLQKRLLLSCIDMLQTNPKNGNCVVYSTCSVSVEENEDVIDYALKMRDVKLVPLGVEAGSPALSNFRGRHFHPSIGQHARRFYPHLHNLDGFFVAKLVKLSSKVPTLTKRYREPRHYSTGGSEPSPKNRKTDTSKKWNQNNPGKGKGGPSKSLEKSDFGDSPVDTDVKKSNFKDDSSFPEDSVSASASRHRNEKRVSKDSNMREPAESRTSEVNTRGSKGNVRTRRSGRKATRGGSSASKRRR
ncbi:putative 28S rRNA (cytosine(4447)-C(5))-methyltransferase [Babesia sp. Xinjiang]|uniref:putative 28S rRNA (cytosine(4447)-C(5))-methyltransferase n=1 Tax=Babesia sp. Xinjiang TaxID=462227 RepID=UPI000A223A0F|nr:putative 28S rRNA (cytosine(4447)-C(5))-methyltransferase [Babesia sp. Xinjiang]ORM41672.1 putative 28S rRNA (cytosine(4447)-C(5))-methyltransferase [Babesia sp. Xinjiang]